MNVLNKKHARVRRVKTNILSFLEARVIKYKSSHDIGVYDFLSRGLLLSLYVIENSDGTFAWEGYSNNVTVQLTVSYKRAARRC